LNKYLISSKGSLHFPLLNGKVLLLELIFWLPSFPFMLMVYQEPMILQWTKVVTVIPLTINSHDKSDEDYRLGPQYEENGYGTASAQQDQVSGAQR
jgi:hypothetical protein